jgi:hypothetical protein
VELAAQNRHSRRLSGRALTLTNKAKLFKFLDYDDVPWNNNNAEHAVRAFTRLRNVMSTSTPKGTREYCILLTLQQNFAVPRHQLFGFPPVRQD